jgi:thiol:disulfide interchange protein DsbD
MQLFIWVLIFTTISFEGVYITSNEKENADLNSVNQYAEYSVWNLNIEEDFKNNNQAYLINFTAAWCITCQANDRIALSRPEVKQYLKENDIEYIVADWTNKNDEILKALEKYNRNGVPLYIYWKPGMQESKILPAILTEGLLLDILKLN